MSQEEFQQRLLFQLSQIETQLDRIMQAFPEGPERHADEHATWKETKKAEADFYKELKLKVATTGIFSTLGIVFSVFLVWLSIKLGLPIEAIARILK